MPRNVPFDPIILPAAINHDRSRHINTNDSCCYIAMCLPEDLYNGLFLSSVQYLNPSRALWLLAEGARTVLLYPRESEGGLGMTKWGLCNLFTRYWLNSGLPTGASVPLQVSMVVFGRPNFFLVCSWDQDATKTVQSFKWENDKLMIMYTSILILV